MPRRPSLDSIKLGSVKLGQKRPIPAQPPTPMPRMGKPPNTIHDDGDASDRSPYPSIAGKTRVIAEYFHPGSRIGGTCSTFAINSRGRLVTLSIAFDKTQLMLLDADTLAVLDTLEVPQRDLPPITKLISRAARDKMFQNVSGGAYFFLDDRDRVVLGASDKQMWIVSTIKSGKDELVVDAKVPLAIDGVPAPLVCIMPAYPATADEPRRYFYATTTGVVGLVEIVTMTPSMKRDRRMDVTTREWSLRIAEFGNPKHSVVGNSFAVNRRGAFLVSSRALYRFESRPEGLVLGQRHQYIEGPDRADALPGRSGIGSGTTPTLIGDDYVGFGDDTQPMHVIVCDQSDLSRNAKIPVFGTDGCCELSFIAHEKSYIVMNTYGYTNPLTWNGKKSPGSERVKVLENPLRLELCPVWQTHGGEVDIGSSTPKLCVGDGLVYAYALDASVKDARSWRFFGIDASTAERVVDIEVFRDKKLERDHDNGWGIVTIGQNGDIYLGMWKGMMRLRGF